MKPKQRSAPAGAVNATVLTFISRAEQLDLRGRRNFDRYMQVVKRFVDPDSPERAAWQQQSAQESLRDAEWNERHGPIAGGASILQWRLGNDAGVQIAEERPSGATSAEELG